MQSFPIISVKTGAVVRTNTVERNAQMLADAANRLAGERLLVVGVPVPMNVAWGKAKDPEQSQLKSIIAEAQAAVPSDLSGWVVDPAELVKQG